MCLHDTNYTILVNKIKSTLVLEKRFENTLFWEKKLQESPHPLYNCTNLEINEQIHKNFVDQYN